MKEKVNALIIPPEREYKALFLPLKLHKKIKTRALKEDKTMIELIQELAH